MSRLLLAALALGCALVAGCGGTSESEATGGSPSSNDRNAAQTRLQECLREQGLDLPEPGQGRGGPGRMSEADREEFQEALEGPCAEYRDDAFGDFDPDDPELQDARAKFRQCMQDEGVDLPEPGSGGGGGPPPGGGIDQDDPEIRAAFEACQDELGDMPGPGGGGPPGGGS